ncbi:SDR family oxidoreductase [Streptomyces sp. NPDC001410]|uniref:SDR family oxidoreductase n=1 Tax=Streptomyces sp. NPDC001410 TaxID=3364574 RepID=UPI00367F65F8
MTTCVTDVSDPAAVAALADVAAELGPVMQVVHTAGTSSVQASAQRVLHVDLLGTAPVLDGFARVIAPDGVGVVISDSGVAYGLSKRANALRVQATAVTWGKRGARVNCISPGIVPTPLVAAYGAEVMRTRRTGPDNKQPPGL